MSYNNQPRVTVNNTTTQRGLGFAGALTILFIALKLTGVITWAWLWVLSPIWISIGLWLAIVLFIALIGAVGYLVIRAMGRR